MPAETGAVLCQAAQSDEEIQELAVEANASPTPNRAHSSSLPAQFCPLPASSRFEGPNCWLVLLERQSAIPHGAAPAQAGRQAGANGGCCRENLGAAGAIAV